MVDCTALQLSRRLHPGSLKAKVSPAELSEGAEMTLCGEDKYHLNAETETEYTFK